MSLIRILLVDDFEPWRRFVRSEIRKAPELRIVYEATNGIEAVEIAKKLKPDLILMDLQLPKLNGIDAARKIRNLAPKSKILFLSQESSSDVVREALGIGLGFVTKADAGDELLPAVNAVMLDRLFLSSRLGGHAFNEATDELVSVMWEAYQGRE